MRRASVVPLKLLLPFLLHSWPAWAAEPAEVAAADAENACFGGDPEVIAARGIGGVSDEPNAKGLHVGDGHLLWQWGNGVEHIELWTWQRDSALAHRAFLKAADRKEAFVMLSSASPSARGERGLVAVNLQNHSRRVVVGDRPGMPFHSRVVLDGDFVYFVRSPLFGEPGKNDGFFRARRDGTGQPERLGAEPSGAFTPFLIDGGYVYWSQSHREGPSAIWRRQLAVDSPSTQLASTANHHLPMALGNGRLFYLDGARILSVPIDGTAPPVELVKGIDVARNPTLLVDRDCLYWTTARAIMRAGLGGKAPVKAEVFAEEANYRGGPL